MGIAKRGSVFEGEQNELQSCYDDGYLPKRAAGPGGSGLVRDSNPENWYNGGGGAIGIFWCGDLVLSDNTNMRREHERLDDMA